jgi:DNA-directed RNA polymerase beta' subunit
MKLLVLYVFHIYNDRVKNFIENCIFEDENVDFMGFSRYWCRPDWMMCTVLSIPPPQVRPSVLQDNNQRSEDDLTQKLVDIIKTNTLLADKIVKNVNPIKLMLTFYSFS